MSEKVVLVTGGTGLVGRALEEVSKTLLTENVQHRLRWVFIGSQLNLATNYYSHTRNVFEAYRPWAVVHLAAKVGGLYKNTRERLDMYRDNMNMNDNVMRACQEFEVKRVVLCLSTCVFPDKIEYPFDETQLHNGPPHTSNEGYAYAKRMLELQARLYNEANPNMNCMCIIPTNIYGPHDNFNLEDSHVIPGLIHRCYLAVKENKPFVVRGTGTAVRQFIHSRDIAVCIARTLLELEPKDIPNGMILAPDTQTEYTIGDVVKLIAAAFGLPEYRIEWDTSYGDGQPRKTASNKLLQSHFPDTVSGFIPLEEGIPATVKWFQENYEQARK